MKNNAHRLVKSVQKWIFLLSPWDVGIGASFDDYNHLDVSLVTSIILKILKLSWSQHLESFFIPLQKHISNSFAQC